MPLNGHVKEKGRKMNNAQLTVSPVTLVSLITLITLISASLQHAIIISMTTLDPPSISLANTSPHAVWIATCRGFITQTTCRSTKDRCRDVLQCTVYTLM